MIHILSVVTSVKDYVEIVHQLINADSTVKDTVYGYNDFGPLITYILLAIKNCFYNLINFNWLKNIWNLPIIVPDISSSMISEVSILNGGFNNIFNFETFSQSYGEPNLLISSFEKLSIGLLNSLFLWLPTSTAHLITLRRFVMQGSEGGYIAGLGTLAGSIVWITCIIFGCRFFVIPWLSLDIFRYFLGFLLLVKYMWASYNERRFLREDLSKQKIFLFHFLLALTEQTSIYPFVSNLSIGAESSIIESFPTSHSLDFFSIHGCYIIGLILGSLTFLHLTCWFVESYGFKIYMWLITSFQVTTRFYYKGFNFIFLYLTMLCAISSIPYYGVDYTLTNPLGFVSEDSIIAQNQLNETSFLNSKASDKNTRRNRGQHGRRERWKRRIRKYRTFDVSLYDQGVYDLFTMEDLNYGFDRFWLRRKMRNHRVRFRFFPGPAMRSFKKELSKNSLESYNGPRYEYFRVLFEHVYNPDFHDYKNGRKKKKSKPAGLLRSQLNLSLSSFKRLKPSQSKALKNSESGQKWIKQNYNIGDSSSKILQNQALLRKFLRKTNARIKSSEIKKNFKRKIDSPIYSKQWKELFSKLGSRKPSKKTALRRAWHEKIRLTNKKFKIISAENFLTLKNQKTQNYPEKDIKTPYSVLRPEFLKKENSKENLSKKAREILNYRSLLLENKEQGLQPTTSTYPAYKFNKLNLKFLLHPLKFYLQRQQAFERKLRYYTPTIFRKFSVENNAPYFRGLMKRFFYYYKPDLRWERTMKIATARKARRKINRFPKKIKTPFKRGGQRTPALKKSYRGGHGAPGATLLHKKNGISSVASKKKNAYHSSDSGFLNSERMEQPTHNYSVVGKKISRYRFQIYKDVLQHWYYNSINRFLLKFDIDLFIKRQPKSHFLTQTEENLLHFRRVLLSDHYNTLRWYTSMEHYRAMKTKIGGTKSFASNPYNQQFKGTFKKIRHLFAITPSQSTVFEPMKKNQNQKNSLNPKAPILKFDQPLINESTNNKSNDFFHNRILHEELLNNPSNLFSTAQDPKHQSSYWTPPETLNLLNNSGLPCKRSESACLEGQTTGQNLNIEQNNYSEAGPPAKQFYKGSKNAEQAQTLLDHQPSNLLFSFKRKENPIFLENADFRQFLFSKRFQQDLSFNLLKNWKEKVNDSESLETYLELLPITQEEDREIIEDDNLHQIVNLNLSKTFRKLEKLLRGSMAAPGPQRGSKKIKGYKRIFNSNVKNQENLKKPEKISTGVQKALEEAVFNTKPVPKFLTIQQKFRPNKEKLDLQGFLKEKTYVTNSLNQLVKIAPENSESQNGLPLKNLLQQSFLKKGLDFLNSSLKKGLNFLKPRSKTLKTWKKKEISLIRQKRARNRLLLHLKQIAGRDRLKIKSDSPAETQVKPNLFWQKEWEDNGGDKKSGGDGRNPNRLTKPVAGLGQPSGKAQNLNKNPIPFQFKLFSWPIQKNPQRRARSFGDYVVSEKRNLSDLFKHPHKLEKFLKYRETMEGRSSELEKLKEIHPTTLQNQFSPSTHAFLPKKAKSQDLIVSNHRVWSEKRGKAREYRKGRRNVLAKLRILTQQMKRMKLKSNFEGWWFKQFLPNLKGSVSNQFFFKTEKTNKLIYLTAPSFKGFEGINKQHQEMDPNFKGPSFTAKQTGPAKEKMYIFSKYTWPPASEGIAAHQIKPVPFSPDRVSFQTTLSALAYTEAQLLITNNPFPFYAGWDASLRKFVVTNRFFSRRESGYNFINQMENFKTGPPLQEPAMLFILNKVDTKKESRKNQARFEPFSSAPLKGLNGERAVCWQSPFTTYDPEQFFLLGLDGFAPLNWRKFKFRHTLLKTWLYQNRSVQYPKAGLPQVPLIYPKSIQIKKKTSYNSVKKVYFRAPPTAPPANSNPDNTKVAAESLLNNHLFYKLKEKNYGFSHKTQMFPISQKSRLRDNQNNNRHLKKRYEHVIRGLKPWLPSGPLLNEVLPIHYISVFYKRSRLPRDRYLKQKTTLFKKTKPFNVLNQTLKPIDTLDFTLRKRVKPKRKYHRTDRLNKKSDVFPRRLKFIGNKADFFRWRPFSARTLALLNGKNRKSMGEIIKEQLNASRLKNKQTRYFKEKQTPNFRVRRLRRRVLRQTIRPTLSYTPKTGGIVWPGAYLENEFVKAPSLEGRKIGISPGGAEDSSIQTRKIKKTKKTSVIEWQSQSRHYLFQKHNIRVIKKKLEKAYRTYSRPALIN